MKTAEQKERDRLRKREVRRLKKEGKWVSAKRSPKLSPNHDRNRPFNCENCGRLWFHRYAETNRFCSTDCSAAFSVNRWIACSKCLAAVGYGAKTTGRLLGVSATSVTRQWKERGIKRAPVKYLKHQAGALKQRRRKLVSAYHSAWMRHEVQHNHPDWSYLWQKEKARRTSAEKYEALSPEAKKQWNRRAMEYRFNKTGRAEQNRRAKEWKRRRRKEDPVWRMTEAMRSRLSAIVKGVRMGGAEGLVGCSGKQLRRHIEAQFKSGMTWQNYGTHWHVDHIMPVSSFNQHNPEQRRRCWHFSNLQPLRAKDNLQKHATILDPQLQLGV